MSNSFLSGWFDYVLSEVWHQQQQTIVKNFVKLPAGLARLDFHGLFLPNVAGELVSPGSYLTALILFCPT